jgi:hypothetical protein
MVKDMLKTGSAANEQKIAKEARKNKGRGILNRRKRRERRGGGGSRPMVFTDEEKSRGFDFETRMAAER